jgi:hypothetical protein
MFGAPERLTTDIARTFLVFSIKPIMDQKL